jgi:hypothetical protein
MYSDGCCLFLKETFELMSEAHGIHKVGNEIMMSCAAALLTKQQKIAVALTAHLKSQNSESEWVIRCRRVDELLEQVDDICCFSNGAF